MASCGLTRTNPHEVETGLRKRSVFKSLLAAGHKQAIRFRPSQCGPENVQLQRYGRDCDSVDVNLRLVIL